MIKLTEIVKIAGTYNESLKKNNASYRLREVFVNPQHVVVMREDETLNMVAERGGVIDGLEPNVRFTVLNLNIGSNTTLKCTVAGTPTSIMEKLSFSRG